MCGARVDLGPRCHETGPARPTQAACGVSRPITLTERLTLDHQGQTSQKNVEEEPRGRSNPEFARSHTQPGQRRQQRPSTAIYLFPSIRCYYANGLVS